MRNQGRDFLIQKESIAVEAYRERLLSAFSVEAGKGKRLLDLGCGDGLEAVYFARKGYQVEAFDLEPHPAWARLKKQWKGQIRFHLGNAAELKGLKGRYDIVFEKDMLHHAAEPLLVLSEMQRLLKKGGRLLIAECNRYNPILYLHLTLLGNHQHFSFGRLKGLLEQSGLRTAQIRRREARVWPIESPAFQKWIDGLQEGIEALRVFSPWLCYNLVSWSQVDA